MSQVVTLYKDKEKTDALYPRTKVSAVSDDNNTSLEELLNRYEIIDNLTSYDKDKALSANQGRELNDNFKNYYNKTEVNNLLDNIDVAGMVKQEEGGTEEEIVTPTNADTLGGKLTANNVVFYEEEIVDEVGQVVLRNADLLENHPASYFATSEDMEQITSVIEAWTDGTNWYRKWSDGWLEQGGFVAYRGAGYFQVTLLKPYENEYYSLTGGCHTPDSSYSDHGYSVSFKMKTTTSFYTAINDDNSLNAGAWTWQACGQGR